MVSAKEDSKCRVQKYMEQNSRIYIDQKTMEMLGQIEKFYSIDRKMALYFAINSIHNAMTSEELRSSANGHNKKTDRKFPMLSIASDRIRVKYFNLGEIYSMYRMAIK